MGFILVLIGVLVLGVFQADRFLRDGKGSTNGDSGTIRGKVETLLPSGKVIAVRRDDGTEVLLSLSEAYTITDELGEDLFYSDVKPGMTITAAGIRGIEDNVIIPSLVTVNLVYIGKGTIAGRFPSFEDAYFSLTYDEAAWEPKSEGVLAHEAVSGCNLSVVKSRPDVPSSWQSAVNERKIGGNVFHDLRYNDNGEQTMRILTLEDPGERYGASRSVGGPVDFVVRYEAPLSGSALFECTRAVDRIMQTFRLRSASENILVIEPRSPVKIKAGEKLVLSGRARAFEGILHLQIVNESGKKILTHLVPVERARSATFGAFSEELLVPRATESRLQIRLFQFSPSDGSIVDVVSLPLTVE